MPFDCIKLEDVDEISVVRFKDEKVMDPSRIEKMGQELMSLAGDDDQRNLLINFEDVRFFSSAAINKLIVLEKRMRAGGGEIKLSNLRPEVRDLFSFTNLDGLFDIREQQSDAIRSFVKSTSD
ncbi:MAG: STAS domain-containing protein [Mariniblastus sp.]|nr:STAS domain-containing protein [Mariniblastus sp.]